MKPKRTAGQEIGVGLLLAGSDAFKQLAEEIATAHDRWQAEGGSAATLEWARRLAGYAAWWCGRLEGEADAVLDLPADVGRPEAGRCSRARRPPC